MIRNALRGKLKAGQTTYGIWVTLESPSITEIAVTLGMDWVVVDLEHGHLDFRELLEHVRVVRGSGTSVIVRVPDIQQGTIKRALDTGSHGVILPVVRSRADVEQGFSFARYPMKGIRGVGGERAVKWGLGFTDYLDCANEEILVIPLIETRDAAECIDDILAVPGLEAIFFGPADLSASHGYLGQWEGPGLAEKILEIRAKAAAKGIAAGVMARSVDESLKRRDQQFGMVAIGPDTGLMIRAIQENMARLGRPAVPRLWF
jgi:2-keto-3-deoxy-L-rhamnonate aldolase RhmA